MLRSLRESQNRICKVPMPKAPKPCNLKPTFQPECDSRSALGRSSRTTSVRHRSLETSLLRYLESRHGAYDDGYWTLCPWTASNKSSKHLNFLVFRYQ